MAYDDAGRIVSREDTLGRKAMWTYDSLGRLETVTKENNNLLLPDQTFTYHYDTPSSELSNAQNIAGQTSGLKGRFNIAFHMTRTGARQGFF